jgi:hypothetical protein
MPVILITDIKIVLIVLLKQKHEAIELINLICKEDL